MNHSVTTEIPIVENTPIKMIHENTKELTDDGQLSLFGMLEGSEAEIVRAVRKTNLLTMTPLEALNCISEWQQKLN